MVVRWVVRSVLWSVFVLCGVLHVLFVGFIAPINYSYRRIAPRCKVELSLSLSLQIQPMCLRHLWQLFLVPAGSDNKAQQLSFLKPAHGQLRTLTYEVQDLIQRERTLSRHGDESCGQTNRHDEEDPVPEDQRDDPAFIREHKQQIITRSARSSFVYLQSNYPVTNNPICVHR